MQKSNISYKETQKCHQLTEFTDPKKLFHDRELNGNNANQRNKVLDILKDGKLHSPAEFQKQGILQYNARIKEIRDRGVRIESLREGHNTWFRMVI